MDDDTIASPDNVGTTIHHGNDSDDNSGGSQEICPDNPAFSAPLKRDDQGRFVKGTGSRGHLGGRPVGAKDKISNQLVEICTELVQNKGSAMLDHLSRVDPAAAMAICLKVVPTEELRRVFNQDHARDREMLQQISINLVSKGYSPELERPAPRPEPSQPTDLREGVERDPREPPEAPVEARNPFNRQALDDKAAELKREQNQRVRELGGKTGYTRGRGRDR